MITKSRVAAALVLGLAWNGSLVHASSPSSLTWIWGALAVPQLTAQAPSRLPSQRFTPALQDEAAAPRSNESPGGSSGTPVLDLLRGDAVQSTVNLIQRSRGELATGNIVASIHWYERAVRAAGPRSIHAEDLNALADAIRQAGGKIAPPDELAQAPAAGNPVPAVGPNSTTQLLTPGAQDIAAPGAPRQGSPPANDTARRNSDALLLTARKALAVGDVRRAGEALAQAKTLQVPYQFFEDNPAKVEAAVTKLADLQQSSADKSSEGYRRRYALLQMEQAADLLAWREYGEAQRLAEEAKQAGKFGPFDPQPDQLLQRIAAARQGTGAPQGPLPTGTPKLEPLPPVASTPFPGAGAPPIPAGDKKAQVVDLVRQARAALAAGDLNRAETLAQSAEALRLPDSAFAPQDDRPFMVLFEIQKRRQSGVTPATANTAPANAPAGGYPETQALFNPSQDATRTTPAAAELLQQPTSPIPAVRPAQPIMAPTIAAPQGAPGQPPAAGASRGYELVQEGEDALRRGDIPTATAKFREAQQFVAELDPVTQQKLQDRANLGRAPQNLPPPGDGTLMREAANQQQLVYRQVSAEVARQEQLAAQLRETEPRRAAEVLQQVRGTVEKAPIEPASKELLMRRLDRSLADLQNYLDVNRAKIELQERNQTVLTQMEREARMKVEVQERIAVKVEEFNQLMDQQRYAEAEILAKSLREMAPEEPVVQQIEKMAKFARSIRNAESIRQEKSDGYVAAMQSVERSAAPFNDNEPIVFPNLRDWKTLSTTRRALFAERSRRRSDKELEIEQKLRTPVLLKFKDAPLTEVINQLSKLTQMNIHLDPQGLSEEGVNFDTPVTIDLNQEISLRSALSLILEPLHLGYVIKNEVLKITSEALKDGEVYTVTYNVADLVVPIPHFVPHHRMGLPGAIDQAYQSMGVGTIGNASLSPMAVVASRDGNATNAVIDPRLLGQINVGGGGQQVIPFGGGGAPQSGFPQQIGFGPGGMPGGGAQPDFQGLIDLITNTVNRTSWEANGGQGTVRQFETNLSLVISNTQQVHEEIQDLLEQLRRLQDLQVTIEVRFISLSDNFYELMGVDFDMDLNDRADRPYQIFGQRNPNISTFPGAGPANNLDVRDFNDRDLSRRQSVTVGLSGPGTTNTLGPYSSDLDIPFRQSSFTQAGLITAGAAGGVAGGAQLGFAILSDIEAYFFINAVQNDQRTNVLQAPKVTLFNGQQAFVSDTSQSPFVVSVTPVVGDFAAAQQPVIVVLSEGTFLTVQAVVSSDRRFVRLTVVPFFSRIGEVNTFTFTGSSTSTRASASDGPDDDTTSRADTITTTNEGTTVQLPTFAFTTVTTTVSVPDGGTVLLGGIKRLTEQRNENGVPLLSKIPYVNRLFTNVGTGRSTSSLMMMVTPRIIIQEEEEALLGVQNQP